MKKSHYIFLPILILTALIHPPILVSEESVFIFPKGQDIHFRDYCYIHSQYISFRTDGTYSRLGRGHFVVTEDDRGRWLQNPDGRVTLISDSMVRDIISGSLYVRYLRRLPALRETIQNYLESNPKERFSIDEVENIAIQDDSHFKYQMIGILDDTISEVSRDDLYGLAGQIEIYLQGDKNIEYYLTPFRYKKFLVLLWENVESPINRDIERIKKSIDRLKDDAYPTCIFVGIDEQTFSRESSSPQEFIYYPELNKCLK